MERNNLRGNKCPIKKIKKNEKFNKRVKITRIP